MGTRRICCWARRRIAAETAWCNQRAEHPNLRDTDGHPGRSGLRTEGGSSALPACAGDNV